MKKINRSETEMRKRSALDWTVLVFVVVIALVVIALSFQNTTILAEKLNLNPYLAGGLVEMFFGGLLFIRGKQRAEQKNVPLFLDAGYFASFGLVTGVNIYGLSLTNPVIGPIVGAAISGGMWLMETVLVWLWVDSNKPYQKTIRERMKDAKKEIQEEKSIQRIEWLRWEAKKPDLSLIKEARKVEEQRKKVIGDGLPEFFNQPLPQPEVHEVIATTVQKVQDQEMSHIVPIKRQIGFYSPDNEINNKPKKSPLFQANMEEREKAIETAKALANELGRKPKKKELMEKGLSDHYSRLAIKTINNR